MMVETAVLDAINGLGLVRLKAASVIQSLLVRAGNADIRSVCIDHLRDGEQVSDDTRLTLGVVNNSPLSRVAFDDLTTLGLADPVHAFEFTIERAVNTIARQTVVSDFEDDEDAQFRVLFHHVGTNSDCDSCDQLNGLVTDLDGVNVFPPPGCVCNAQYVIIPQLV